MGLKLEIELNRLVEPDVALAVAHLIEALSGTAAFLPVGAPKASSRAAAAPFMAAPPIPRALPPLPNMTPRERFLDFVENLPERSREFLELVREKKLLKISEAMERLDVDAPKAMGGLTGSIGRWAPLRGVDIPYEATTADGERAWRWVGGPGSEPEEGEDESTEAASKARYLPPVVVTKPVPLVEVKRPPAEKAPLPPPLPYIPPPYPAKEKDKVALAALAVPPLPPPVLPPVKPVAKPAPKAAVVEPVKPAVKAAAVEAAMPPVLPAVKPVAKAAVEPVLPPVKPAPKAAAVEPVMPPVLPAVKPVAKAAAKAAAVEPAARPAAKAVEPVLPPVLPAVKPVAKAAVEPVLPPVLPAAKPAAQVAAPAAVPSLDAYKAPEPAAPRPRGRPPKAKVELEAYAAPKAVEPAPKAAPKAVEPAPKAAPKAVEPSPYAAPKAVEAPKAQVVPSVAPLTDELLDQLPTRSRQFITLLHQRKVLRMADVLSALDLARPRSVGGVTEPVLRAARDLGLPKPFVGGKDAEGRVWLLPGTPAPADVELD